jgi:hypothetical protein
VRGGGGAGGVALWTAMQDWCEDPLEEDASVGAAALAGHSKRPPNTLEASVSLSRVCSSECVRQALAGHLKHPPCALEAPAVVARCRAGPLLPLLPRRRWRRPASPAWSRPSQSESSRVSLARRLSVTPGVREMRWRRRRRRGGRGTPWSRAAAQERASAAGESGECGRRAFPAEGPRLPLRGYDGRVGGGAAPHTWRRGV